MEHKMHKADRQLSKAETLELLLQGHHGTLSVNGEDGYPYATPVNYVVMNDKVYIHSAYYGYKMESLQKSRKCCFSTIISAEVLPSKFTAKFESVIITGNVAFVESKEEKQAALETFVTTMGKGYEDVGYKMVKGLFYKTAVLRIDPQEVTGKAWRG